MGAQRDVPLTAPLLHPRDIKSQNVEIDIESRRIEVDRIHNVTLLNESCRSAAV